MYLWLELVSNEASPPKGFGSKAPSSVVGTREGLQGGDYATRQGIRFKLQEDKTKPKIDKEEESTVSRRRPDLEECDCITIAEGGRASNY